MFEWVDDYRSWETLPIKKWMRHLLTKTITISALTAVFLSIGSIGVYLNWGNPAWNRIGVDPKVLSQSIRGFPEAHCTKATLPLCNQISNGVVWFLGL